MAFNPRLTLDCDRMLEAGLINEEEVDGGKSRIVGSHQLDNYATSTATLRRDHPCQASDLDTRFFSLGMGRIATVHD